MRKPQKYKLEALVIHYGTLVEIVGVQYPIPEISENWWYKVSPIGRNARDGYPYPKWELEGYLHSQEKTE